MEVYVFHNSKDLANYASDVISYQIEKKPDTVLGCATGGTPLETYSALASDVAAGKLDCSQVITVNLDEYYPISQENPQSYYAYMKKYVWDPLRIKEENRFIPDGSAKSPIQECIAYDMSIKELGGIDLQILGIGPNGHLGFNEPADCLTSGTHLTELTETTREANRRFFREGEEVPHAALTMGMGSIFSAKRLLVMATGESKKAVLEKLISDKITTSCPATLLKLHPNCTLICDVAACPDRFDRLSTGNKHHDKSNSK